MGLWILSSDSCCRKYQSFQKFPVLKISFGYKRFYFLKLAVLIPFFFHFKSVLFISLALLAFFSTESFAFEINWIDSVLCSSLPFFRVLIPINVFSIFLVHLRWISSVFSSFQYFILSFLSFSVFIFRSFGFPPFDSVFLFSVIPIFSNFLKNLQRSRRIPFVRVFQNGLCFLGQNFFLFVLRVPVFLLGLGQAKTFGPSVSCSRSTP